MTICVSCGNPLLGFADCYLHYGEKFRACFPDISILYCRHCGLQQVDHSDLDENELMDYYRHFYREDVDIVALSKYKPAMYDAFWRERGRALARIAAQHINPDKVGKVFEVGAGYGYNLLEFRKRWGHAGLFTDEPESCLPPQEVSRSTLEDGPYDIVIMSHVLEHIRYPRAFIARVADNLSQGGLLVIEVPNEGDGFVYQEKNGVPLHTGHLTFFNGEMLRLFFNKNFKQLSIKHIGTAGPTIVTALRLRKLRKTLPSMMRNAGDQLLEFAIRYKMMSAFDFKNDSETFDKVFLRIVLVRE